MWMWSLPFSQVPYCAVLTLLIEMMWGGEMPSWWGEVRWMTQASQRGGRLLLTFWWRIRGGSSASGGSGSLNLDDVDRCMSEADDVSGWGNLVFSDHISLRLSETRGKLNADKGGPLHLQKFLISVNNITPDWLIWRTIMQKEINLGGDQWERTI